MQTNVLCIPSRRPASAPPRHRVREVPKEKISGPRLLVRNLWTNSFPFRITFTDQRPFILSIAAFRSLRRDFLASLLFSSVLLPVRSIDRFGASCMGQFVTAMMISAAF